MNTKTILATLVVLIFLTSCTQSVLNSGEQAKPLDSNNLPPSVDTTGQAPKDDTNQEVPKPAVETPIEPTPQPDKKYPVTLTAEKVGDNVKLTWTPYEGKITSYKIVRSTTDPNPKYPGADLLETLVFVNETTYTDTKSQVGINYYSVGVLTITNKGDMSNVAAVEFADSREKEGNKITLTAVKTSEGVNLTWNAYDESGSKLMYYKVVRSDTNPRPKYPNDNGVVAIPYVDKTSYIDRGTDPGKTYYYALTVVRKDMTRYTSDPVIVTI